MSYDHQKLSSRMAHAIRFLAADAINRSKSGHPGMPLGMADVATVLFSRYVKINPAAPRWFDRFIFWDMKIFRLKISKISVSSAPKPPAIRNTVIWPGWK